MISQAARLRHRMNSVAINRTHIEHAAVALVIQIALSLITGNIWVGAAAGSFFFIGREHDQAEYRWIKAFGCGHRANLPLFGGLDPRVWRGQYDAWLDWVVPTLAVVGVACAVEYGF